MCSYSFSSVSVTINCYCMDIPGLVGGAVGSLLGGEAVAGRDLGGVAGHLVRGVAGRAVGSVAGCVVGGLV